MSAQEVVKYLQEHPGWHPTDEISIAIGNSRSACAANCRRAAYRWELIEHKAIKSAGAKGAPVNFWRGIP